MIACLLDTFGSNTSPAASEFRTAARVIRKSVAVIKRDIKVATVFRPDLFRRVVGAATDVAINHGFVEP